MTVALEYLVVLAVSMTATIPAAVLVGAALHDYLSTVAVACQAAV